jgi:hypothetical protein
MSAPPKPVLPDLPLLSDSEKIAAIQKYVSSHLRSVLALGLVTLPKFLFFLWISS